MNTVKNLDDARVVDCLVRGGIVVARTDTLYGVLARADDERAVSRVYALKDRSAHKSPIVLISSLEQLYDTPSLILNQVCDQHWPGPVSVIVPSQHAPRWIRRENNSVAYRLPNHDALRKLISQVGPLIAPSANPEGYEPAQNIEEAYKYFGDMVDVYVDSGQVHDPTPSQIIRIHPDRIERLR